MSVKPRARGGDWGSDDSETNVLHVDMDSFFAAVEMVRHPELQGRPVIVGGHGNRGVVTSCTYDVRARGVRAGMPMARARALAPTATVVAGSRGIYSEYSRRVMNVLARVTPQLEQVSIDEAFLDVAGARRRLGTPRQIAVQLRTDIRAEVSLPASVGIGANKTVAKIASGLAKPDGIQLVAADQTTSFLHSLPIGSLPGVGSKTAARLGSWGVETVGDLAAFDQRALAKRVGESAARNLQDLAMGRDERPVATSRRDKSISTERTFGQNLHVRAEVEMSLLAAAHDCARRLRQKELVAWVVQVKLRDGDFHTITRSQTLPAPTDLGREVAGVARRLFAELPLPRTGVRLAGVGVQALVQRSEGVQLALGEDGRPRAGETAMDQANARFGDGSLQPASLLRGRPGERPAALRAQADVSVESTGG